MKKCKFCQEYPNADGRKCYNKYGLDNWNCEMLNKLRNLFEWSEHPLVKHIHNEDQHSVLIRVFNILDKSAMDLYLTWYKHRGRVESIKLLYDTGKCINPTEKELTTIISYFTKEHVTQWNSEGCSNIKIAKRLNIPQRKIYEILKGDENGY